MINFKSKIKKLFNKFSLYNYIYLACAYVIIIVGLILSDDKNYFSFTTSLIGVTAFLFSAKGLVVAPMLSSIYYVMYGLLSLTQKYYGEAIVNGLISLPIAIFSIITWLRNKNKKENVDVQVNQLKKKEYLCMMPALIVIFVGAFFMLKALNANQVVINTISIVCCIAAGYLMMRRSPFYALAYICADIAVITLWSITIFNGGLSYLPTLLSVCCFFVNDVYGLVNWQRKGRKQKLEETEQIQ